MKRVFVFILCATLGLLSCKKDKSSNSGPTAHKNPVLNDTEKYLLGVWALDSTSTSDASNVYLSHSIPDPAVTETRIAFYELFDCGSCSDAGYYMAGQGTTPGKFDPAVWSAPASDSLRFGPIRVYMNGYKIVLLNAPSLVIKLKASNGNTTTSYYRRSS
jgi:hypothetical protein